MTEERHTWDIFWCWFYFLTEVWSLDMGCNWKSPKLISWLVLFWIHFIFQYTIFYFKINIVCFVMLVFIYNFHFVIQPNIIFELICHCDWIFSIFTINSRYKDIHLCLLDIICIFTVVSYWTLSFIQISMLVISY